jgi:hypothetical protein
MKNAAVGVRHLEEIAQHNPEIFPVHRFPAGQKVHPASNGKFLANPASLPPKARGQPTIIRLQLKKPIIRPFTVKGAEYKAAQGLIKL